MEISKKNLWIKRSVVITFFLLLLTGVVLLYVFFADDFAEIVKDNKTFKAWLDQFGPISRLVFVFVRAFQTVIKVIPAEPLEIGAGYAFGTWGGLLYCSLGTFIGSLVIVAFTKIFGTKMLDVFVPLDKIKNLKFLQDSKKLSATLFAVYLIPATPKDIITYLVCFTDMKLSKFFLITSIARIPSIITSTWCGSELVQENYLASAMIFGITAILAGIGLIIYRKFFLTKNNTEEEADSSAEQ